MQLAADQEDPVENRRVLVVGARRLYLEALCEFLSAQPGISATWLLSSALELQPDGGEDPAVVVLDGLGREDDTALLVQRLSVRFQTARLLILGPPTRHTVASWRGAASARYVSVEDGSAELVGALAGRSPVRPTRRGFGVAQGRDELLMSSLSARERAVLRMITTGETAEQIAAALGISRHTVRTHVQNIMSKLGARSRVEMVNMARRAAASGALGDEH